MERGEDKRGKWIKVYLEPEFKTPTNWENIKPKWNNFFYFRDSKKTRATLPKDVDGTISSVIKFHDDYFYKVQALSIKDPIWDYYRKKKDNIDPAIINFGKGVIPRIKKKKLYNHSEYKYENREVELSFA